MKPTGTAAKVQLAKLKPVAPSPSKVKGGKRVDIPRLPQMSVSEDMGADMRGLLGNVSYRYRMSAITALTSTAAGEIAFSATIAASAFNPFTTLSTLFDEYRILSGRIFYVPNDRYTKVTPATKVFVVCFDNDATAITPLTTIAEAWEYGTSKVHSLDDPFEYHWRRPNITASAYWTDFAAAPTADGAIYINSPTGLSVSTEYGTLMLDVEIDMRSTR